MENTQPNPNMDPADAKLHLKMLMGNLGSYGHALTQNRKYGSLASQDWQTTTGREVARQWDAVKYVMEELGF